MLANILNSEKAVRVSVQIVRTFVRLREMLASNAGLARKLETLEKRYDQQFKVVFCARGASAFGGKAIRKPSSSSQLVQIGIMYLF